MIEEDLKLKLETIDKELPAGSNGFVFGIEAELTSISCNNILFESSELCIGLELLAIRLAKELDIITRLEMYTLCGIAPEIINSVLETLRSQNYLQYVIPYEKDRVHDNLALLKKQLQKSYDPIFQKDYKEWNVLKQYKLTLKGEKLFKTKIKETVELGKLSFLLIDGPDFYLMCTPADEFGKNRFFKNYRNSLNSDFFGFMESFLLENQDDLAKDRVFKELTSTSEVEYRNFQGHIWEIQRNNGFDDKTQLLFEPLNDRIIPLSSSSKLEPNLGINELNNRICLYLEDLTGYEIELQQNKQKGINHSFTFTLFIDEEEIIDQVFEEFENPHKGYLDLIVEDNENEQSHYYLCRVLLVPINEASYHQMLFWVIKAKSTNSPIKSINRWETIITNQVEGSFKIEDLNLEKKKIVDKINRSNELFILEDEIKNELEQEFDMIGNLDFQIHGNKIEVDMWILDDVFTEHCTMNSFKIRKIKRKMTRKKKSMQFSYNLIPNSPILYFAGLIHSKIEKGIVSRSLFREYFNNTKNQVEAYFPDLAQITENDVINELDNRFDKNVEFADEYLAEYLQSSSLGNHIHKLSVKEIRGRYQCEIILRDDLIDFTLHDAKNDQTLMNYILGTGTKFTTPKNEINYNPFILLNDEKAILKLVRMVFQIKYSGESMTTISIEQNFNGLVQDYCQGEIRFEITQEDLSQFLDLLRTKGEINIAEDLVLQDLLGLFELDELPRESELVLSNSGSIIINFIIGQPQLEKSFLLIPEVFLWRQKFRKLDSGIRYEINILPKDNTSLKFYVNKRFEVYCIEGPKTEIKIRKYHEKIMGSLEKRMLKLEKADIQYSERQKEEIRIDILADPQFVIQKNSID